MKPYFLSFVLALTALLNLPGRQAAAQALPLEQLHKLSTLPPDLPFGRITQLMLPGGWIYQGRVDQTSEVCWTMQGAAPDSLDPQTAESWLSLRPMPTGTTDVLFKTRLARNFDPLRRELRRLKIGPLPVTCPDCQGERYETAAYTITLYSGKKGAYRYIAVLHPLSSPAAPAELAPAIPAVPAVPAAPIPEVAPPVPAGAPSSNTATITP